jgi:hypothetical protein
MDALPPVTCPACGRTIPHTDPQHDVQVATALDGEPPDVYVTQCRVMLGLNPTHIIHDDD